ncbi:type II CRISPR RNA-guided endonuclease Cas9 [uncultured Desulfuromonas sp.]|uniref:type II CRISPR RNA-guided endonuclease Cas9 n=1 Tax=uncultured Desulfuromonas sp. TaxID=181013 RepID=UPI002AAC1CF4|nr:type II CRISPR RNA-guided endonuclease Cas9 [uncultured Desulfuromonas sp.]
MRYRLGLDLGTNSIGWTILEIVNDGNGLNRFCFRDMGVRIFPDGREPAKGGRVGDSLAVSRRLARGMRRNRDRGKNRMAYMMSSMVELGLMPVDKEERKKLQGLNPYQLRAEALERPLTPYELGRALFHLGLRRGFKSNRKEAVTDPEASDRQKQISALREALGGRTLGQFLWERLNQKKSVRFRENSEWFPERTMYADEFDAIQKFQTQYHMLTDADWLHLKNDSVLFQHPLRPVERGRCTLYPEFQRAHRDTPIAQWFRIYQDITHLRWIDVQQNDHPLNVEQRDAIVQKLLTQKSGVKWGAIRRLKNPEGTLLFERDCRFNMESESCKQLKPHKIAIWMQADEHLAALWDSLDQTSLDDIFEKLHGNLDDDILVANLVREHKVTPEQAEALAALPIGSTTMNLSREVMQDLLPVMRDQGLEYYDAVTQLTDSEGNPLHHSQLNNIEKREILPYYGELLSRSLLGGDSEIDPDKSPEGHFGRIANPTVHVALNQLRVVVNALIERFGNPPEEIHVELSRDLKLGPKQRSEINREIAKNTRRNERLSEEWAKISGGRTAPPRDLRKLKLWEELGTDLMSRRCVFTGKIIAAHHLLNGEVEIEHILPFSRTLDDTNANTTLAFKGANLAKGNQTPFEAFGNSQYPEFNWDEILDRASRLPKSKRWRFSENAMERWEGDNDFIARQLTDNAYIARAARKYLTCLTDHVVPAPGKLTAMIRGKWRLNFGDNQTKSRDDHRHHAVDSFVIALSDRSLLNKISKMSARGTDSRLHVFIPDLPEQLRTAFNAKFHNLLVSYKQDHGVQGRYFNETAYGVLTTPTPEGYNLAVRKPLASLSLNELDAIQSDKTRERIFSFLEEQGWNNLTEEQQSKQLSEYLTDFGQRNNMRRVRILVKNQSVIRISSAHHKAYAPDSFVCCDIWSAPKGKPGKWQKDKQIWQGVFWNYAECTQGVPDKNLKKPHPAARHHMRLFKDDLVSLMENKYEKIMRVAGFSTTNNKLDLKPHNLADAPRQFISINQLGEKQLRQVFISPDGRYLNRR